MIRKSVWICSVVNVMNENEGTAGGTSSASAVTARPASLAG
jgi:hypothetical protein